MKIIVTAEALNGALKAVEPAIGRSGLIKLEGVGRRIILTATSEKGFSIEATMDGTIEEVGTIIVPRQAFASLTYISDDEEIDITAVPDQSAVIDWGEDSTDKVVLVPLTQWRQPDFGETSEFTEVSIKATDLLAAIDSTKFAVSTKMSRPAYTGVRMQVTDGKLTAIATDSYRVARKVVPATADGSIAVTVGGEALAVLKKLFLHDDSDDATVTLKITRTLLVVQNESIRMSTALIEGGYPDVSAIMSMTGSNELAIDKEALLPALQMCLPFHNTVEKRVVAKLTLKADHPLHLHTELEEFGTHDAVVPCAYTGQDLTVGLCVDYLLQGVAVLTGDTVKLYFGEDMKPVQIVSDGDDSYQYVLAQMKMR